LEITFLGTSAANAYPEAFCSCCNCERARRLGGPSWRKRSAALIDDELLIDLGPDIMTASVLHGRPLSRVRHCLQTHAHADHLDPSHFLSRSPEFGVVGAPRLHFYGSEATLRRASDMFQAFYDAESLDAPGVGDRLNLQLHPVQALLPFQAGAYRVTAFSAQHSPILGCLLFAIEADGRAIFYGTDTGPLSADTWRAFHDLGMRFDVVILDHTYGLDQADGQHLNAEQLVEHVARMRREGLLADGARALATHISHPSNPPHSELAEVAAKHGYEVAYDGLTI
jgi:phosphoribosyl 1,2-cyclic phosphate phosphodiesterase